MDAIDLNTPLPRRLWKYKQWDEHGYAKQLVTAGECFFCRPADLNDPFEFCWEEDFPTEPGELRNYLHAICAFHFPHDGRRERKRRMEVFRRELRLVAPYGRRAVIQQFDQGVFCMTENSHNILMWSHYADFHRGVCLGIDTSRLSPRRILKVQYSTEMPLLSGWSYTKQSQEAFVLLSLTKSVDWSYEQEWRTVSDPGVKFYPGCVDQLILGARISPETKSAVMHAVQDSSHQIDVFQAIMSSNKFALRIEPLQQP